MRDRGLAGVARGRKAELVTAELTSGDQARSTMCGLTAEMGFGERSG